MRYQAGATPYSDRSSTGWIAPACLLVPALDPLAYKLVLPPILERLRALRFHSDLVRLYLFLAVPQSLIQLYFRCAKT